MKIAITAATGKLGGAVVEALLAHSQKPEIIGISRNPSNLTAHGMVGRQGDYNDADTYKQALKGVDAVLLISGMDDPKKRIQQHRNVINSAVACGVKKIVYTSILGNPNNAGFSPVVASNRQTEEDVLNSGLDWVIGRNGLYIEPDIEYLDNYISTGKIANCAGDGKCAYTTREELGYAYACMLLENDHNGNTYNLLGPAITQKELVDLFNHTFGLNLIWEPMSVEAYKEERTAELGEFLGTIISGIYEGIRAGYANAPSDFARAAGREHIPWSTYFNRLVQSSGKRHL